MKYEVMDCPMNGCRAFLLNHEVRVLVGIEIGLWHMSISCINRYPTYDEIKFARYKFCPKGATMVMYFPPPDEFVNIHPNCFHLWEIKEKPVSSLKLGIKYDNKVF